MDTQRTRWRFHPARSAEQLTTKAQSPRKKNFCRPGESGGPLFRLSQTDEWVPAFAGTTGSWNPLLCVLRVFVVKSYLSHRLTASLVNKSIQRYSAPSPWRLLRVLRVLCVKDF